MSIQEFGRRIKGFLYDEELFLAVLVLIVAFASFGLGRYSAIEKSGISDVSQMEERFTINNPFEGVSSEIEGTVAGEYVASKNGTKYHLPWCAGAERIKEENKVWFESVAEAKAAGYDPAANCEGI